MNITTTAANLRKLAEPSEKDFAQQVIDYAHMRGWVVAHFRSVPVAGKGGKVRWQTPVQADGAGFPDLFLVRMRPPFRAVALELKVGKNAASDEQRTWVELLNKAGIEAGIVKPCDWSIIERILA